MTTNVIILIAYVLAGGCVWALSIWNEGEMRVGDIIVLPASVIGWPFLALVLGICLLDPSKVLWRRK